MKKRKMKMGEALVGMKRRGSQLLKQNILSVYLQTLKETAEVIQVQITSGARSKSSEALTLGREMDGGTPR